MLKYRTKLQTSCCFRLDQTNTITMQIKNLRPTDDGQYSVKLHNSEGEAEEKFKLMVACKHHHFIPYHVCQIHLAVSWQKHLDRLLKNRWRTFSAWCCSLMTGISMQCGEQETIYLLPENWESEWLFRKWQNCVFEIQTTEIVYGRRGWHGLPCTAEASWVWTVGVRSDETRRVKLEAAWRHWRSPSITSTCDTFFL